MRPLLPALLLLCAACSPLASSSAPAYYSAQQGATQAPATSTPDWALLAAEAQVRAANSANQTATSAAQVIATQTQVAIETQGAGTAMFASASATGAAVEYSERLQAVSASQAAATLWAGAATQTAAAAIPAETQAAAAALATAEREERGAWAWLIAGVVAFLLVVGGAVYSVARYVRSLGIEKEAKARQLVAQIQPPVLAKKEPLPGIPGYVVLFIDGRMVTEYLDALRVAENAPPRAEAPEVVDMPPALANVTPRPYMTKEQASLIAFVKDAQRAAGVKVATFLPSDDRMGYGGSRWGENKATLERLGVVKTTGTGKPKSGEHRTVTTPGWDLTRILESLEDGRLVAPTAPRPVSENAPETA